MSRYNERMTRDALLLVDLQNAFFNEEGLDTQEQELTAAANRLSQAAIEAELPVFVVTTVHSRDTSTWTLNMLEAGEGFLFFDEQGTEVISGVNTDQTTRIEKTRDSAFFATDLHLRLTNLHVDRIVLAGVSTHGCISQTARDAYALNIRTVIISNATADARHDYHEAQLQRLEEDRQATTATIDEIIAAWQGASKG